MAPSGNNFRSVVGFSRFKPALAELFQKFHEPCEPLFDCLLGCINDESVLTIYGQIFYGEVAIVWISFILRIILHGVRRGNHECTM